MRIHGERLEKYLQLVWEKCDWFSYFSIEQILGEDNNVADKLAPTASGMEESTLP